MGARGLGRKRIAAELEVGLERSIWLAVEGSETVQSSGLNNLRIPIRGPSRGGVCPFRCPMT